VDDSHNIYIAGNINNTTFPVTPDAYQNQCGGQKQVYLSKFSPNAQSLLYSTCLGGSGGQSWASDLTLRGGMAYVVGGSLDPLYPLKHEFLSALNSGAAFLSIIDTNASAADSLVASTYVGSPSNVYFTESATGVALDPQGDVYVAGYTNSTNLPVQDSFQSTYGGGQWDCFLTKVSTNGRWPAYRTYLGGEGSDTCNAIAADTSGNVIVVGSTNSSYFPTANPLQGSIGSSGQYDAFISRISMGNREALMVNLSGPHFISPGDKVTYLVDYKNALAFDAENAVVQVSLPGVASYVTASGGAFYRAQNHEVFWKLGAVPKGAEGSMILTVEYQWGISAHQTLSKGFGVEVIRKLKCNKAKCMYEPAEFTYCRPCEKCVDRPTGPECLGVTEPEYLEEYLKCKDEEVLTAGDPNAKYGFDGDVIPGQSLDYTIDYENVGQGTAHGVFILDKLDANLDESTLVINNGGIFNSISRTVAWDIGTLDPNGTGTYKGSVSFSVKVKDSLPSGTEIINRATVYFPSVPEVTPTNPVVNRVYAIVAHPQKLEIEAGAALPITLAGLDAGGAPLTYRVVKGPMYGEITGTPPDLTYTSMGQFNGLDKFQFVASNGTVDSQPADVTIVVFPSSSDTTPPTVLFTFPEDDAENVPVSLSPLAQNAYLPVISARFSEPIDPSTVNTGTFTVSGITGTVTYDVLSWTAYFMPCAPLAHGTTYTATLTTGIRDGTSNTLAEDHVWQFSTNTEVQIKAVLNPPESTGYGFGGVIVGGGSEAKIVVVSSAGTADLVIGTLTFTGAGKDDFIFDGDNCSGESLAPGQDCTVRVAFKPLSGGLRNAVLSIPSNDPDENPKNIPLSGTGLLSNVSINPSSYDFGTMNIGSTSAAVPFTISSTGTGELIIASIGVTGGDASMFNVATGTCPNLAPTIPNGTSCTILVTFTPGSAGVAETTLRIISNDPDSPTLDVPLSGRGGKLTFYRDEGALGTQFSVTGTDFGSKKGKVLIGGAAAKVMEWDNAHIKCLLSKAPQTGPGLYDAVVQIKDPKGTAAITEVEAFTVKAPEITTPNPHGAPEAEVVLNGNFFGTKKGKVALEVGGKLRSCKVTDWSMNAIDGSSEVKFVVPKGLAEGTYPLKLINKVGTGTIDFAVEGP